MSLFGNDDQARRLLRAKLQYENLLMHAGENLIDKDATDANNSFSSETYEPAYRTHSPVRPAFRDTRHQYISPGFDRSVPHLNDSLYDENPLTESDKDGIIVSLQEEIDRLRDKLDSVVSSVENVIQDAQGAQNDIKSEHDSMLHELRKKNMRLEEENRQLRVTLELSQAELAVERDHLLKAARFIERLKRRGREYAEVQRKSAHLLYANSALSTTHTSSNPTSHRARPAGRTTYSTEEEVESSGHERLYGSGNAAVAPGSGNKKGSSAPGSGKKNVNFVRR